MSDAGVDTSHYKGASVFNLGCVSYLFHQLILLGRLLHRICKDVAFLSPRSLLKQIGPSRELTGSFMTDPDLLFSFKKFLAALLPVIDNNKILSVNNLVFVSCTLCSVILAVS